MNLLIAMPGPQLPESEADAAAWRDALPALPALTELLTRARRLPSAADWRSGILAALHDQVAGETIPAAALAARACPAVPVGATLCFATPLHVVAGMSRMHLPPDGWLQFEDDEAAQWVETFNREFGAPALQLHAVTGGWLLAAPFAAAASDAAPETLIGQPLARAPARDASERALRRLGAEVEIWLAGHPLNRAREARQQPPFNSLWFWGGARALQLPRFSRAPRSVLVAGEPDAWLAGLAAHCGASLGSVADWRSLAATNDVLLVLAAPTQGMSAAHWQELEARWFEPAARALRAGAIDALRLQIGASAWQLPDRSPLRWLRRRQPWYQRVST